MSLKIINSHCKFTRSPHVTEVWIALDDASAETGVVEYLAGTHHMSPADRAAVQFGGAFHNSSGQDPAEVKAELVQRLQNWERSILLSIGEFT